MCGKHKINRIALFGALALWRAEGTRAGTIDAELEVALRSTPPGQELPVIVTLTDKADLGAIRDRNRRVRRTKVITALRQHANRTQGPVLMQLNAERARRLRSLWLINAIAVRVPAQAIPRLARRPDVQSVRLDQTFSAPVTPPGPPAASEWNINAIRAPDVWALGHTGQGVVVASLDTGVDAAHPDLSTRWRGGANSWLDPHGEHPAIPFDATGHGTQVMGLMVGGDAGGTSIGVAPDARWIAAKIFNDAGQAAFSAVHQSFQWVLDPDGDPLTDDAADVVNNSWEIQGSNGCDTEFEPDIRALKAAGIPVVFAAGNAGPSPASSQSPADNVDGFAAGAVGQAQAPADFSSRGPSACDGTVFPELAAPGVDVNTADLSFGGPALYTVVSGTSFAAPHVSGAIALLLGALPARTVAEIEAALKQSALDLGVAGSDNDTGAGLLDVRAAYALLLGPALPPQAVADSYSTDEDVVLDVLAPGVLGNDTGSPTAAILVSGPAHGNLTLNADGSLRYQPDPDFNGSDSFSYQASDGALQSGEALVTLNVRAVNDAPAITSTPVTTATQGAAYRYDTDARDPDAADTLGFSLAVAPAGMSIDAASGLITWTPASAGNYPVRVRVTNAGGLSATQSFTITVQAVSAPILLYFSTANNSAVPGVAGPYDDADIYGWNGRRFTRLFDGSAAGLPANADIDALAVVDANTILLSFSRDAGTRVPGLGLVQDEDIVLYDAGRWSLYFDGSDAGLGESNAEDVDAFAILADGSAVVSTLGNATVPGRGTQQDEDLLRCAGSFGPATRCTWSVYFDGTGVGLNTTALEDVDGAAVSGGALYLSTRGAFAVRGLAGSGSDVMICRSPTTGPGSACASFGMFFQGSAHGITDNLDAIALPQDRDNHEKTTLDPDRRAFARPPNQTRAGRTGQIL